MEREELVAKLREVIYEADSHSCMYSEGLDTDDVAQEVADWLGETFPNMPPPRPRTQTITQTGDDVPLHLRIRRPGS